MKGKQIGHHKTVFGQAHIECGHTFATASISEGVVAATAGADYPGVQHQEMSHRKQRERYVSMAEITRTMW